MSVMTEKLGWVELPVAELGLDSLDVDGEDEGDWDWGVPLAGDERRVRFCWLCRQRGQTTRFLGT